MSNSKQITAVLVLQAAEQGKLDLQTPIKKYLPAITQSWADTVTVHNLLNHTHGIVDLEKPVILKPVHSSNTETFPICFWGKFFRTQPEKALQSSLTPFSKS
jgi:CubicO group peptidase (beta-lactamase class C family)